MEKLLIEHIEHLKVIFTTTKTGIYFNNKDKSLHEFKFNIVYKFTCFNEKIV